MPDTKDPRVLFAAERTLLAWNRTSLALIAFGFLVERSGLLMAAVSGREMDSGSVRLSFWLGFGFLAIGVFAAVLSSRQYLRLLTTLGPEDFPDNYAPRWGVVINILVAVLGAIMAVGFYFLRP
ncbi:YidH family protein [Gilvimarinus sp. F26214L]|uniref:YidH family protein n=1 Tax=Gilvimarinus sp. DZF01 TaxID=3461371 RepID=UPI0040467B8F